MTGLSLVAVGAVPQRLLGELSALLAERTGTLSCVSDIGVDPSSAYDPDRGQYDCRRILPILDVLASRTGGRVLGVAGVDLYSPVFSFVFGEARLNGHTGVVSFHRLRPDLYGLPENPQLLGARIRRVALHEMGHLLGLVHCWNPDCVMRFSGAAEEVDLKTDRFCRECGERLVSRGVGVSGARELGERRASES